MSKPTTFGLFQLVWHFLKRFGIFLQVVWHFLFTWTWQPWLGMTLLLCVVKSYCFDGVKGLGDLGRQTNMLNNRSSQKRRLCSSSYGRISSRRKEC